jgi:hypothetical protein
MPHSVSKVVIAPNTHTRQENSKGLVSQNGSVLDIDPVPKRGGVFRRAISRENEVS